jgi:hypothetical protein
LSEEQYILTAALPANKAVLQWINLGQAALYLNFINLTAYDFFGAWTPRTGHQSQLYAMSKDETSGSTGVGYLMQAGVPGKKILLGIPLFGRSFLHATGTGQKFKGVGGEDGSFEYKDLPRRSTREQVDKRSVAAQCVGGDGGFVTYDNPDTVKMKAAFCKQKGLGVSPFQNFERREGVGQGRYATERKGVVIPFVCSIRIPSQGSHRLLAFFLSLDILHSPLSTHTMLPLGSKADRFHESGALLLVRTGRCQRQQAQPDCVRIPSIT